MRRWAVAGSVGAAFLAAGGCFLDDLDLANRPCPCTDGYVCVADVCIPGDGSSSSSTASGTGGMTTSSSATGTSSTSMSDVASSSSSSSTGGMTLPLASALVYESTPQSGTLSLATAGAFRIQSNAQNRWQWSRYFDLGNADPDNLSSTLPPTDYQNTELLFEPGWFTTDGSNWASSQSATVLDITVTDETPLRVLVETTLAYPFTGAELYSASYTYASGRVATYVELDNTGAADLTFAQVEYNYVAVNANLAGGGLGWTESSYKDLGVAFVHEMGPSPKSAVFFVNVFGDTNLHKDSPHTSYYWGDFGAVTIPSGGNIAADGELQLGPAGAPLSELVARTDDVLNPELEIMSGATPVNGGYDAYLGAYVLAANTGAPQIVFGASSAFARHAPVFEVRGLSATKWRALFRGQEVCSSSELVGHGCVAWRGPDRLALELMVDIPAAAPAEDRMITLEFPP
ncbi:MAG: hypothetical protein U0414_39480 [Polyangiaceae bacterium]